MATHYFYPSVVTHDDIYILCHTPAFLKRLSCLGFNNGHKTCEWPKSGTLGGTDVGTSTPLEWYLANRDTLNQDDDLNGYNNSKLSEPKELVDLILKEKPDYWMRTNGDLEHCLRIIMRHVEAGHA